MLSLPIYNLISLINFVSFLCSVLSFLTYFEICHILFIPKCFIFFWEILHGTFFFILFSTYWLLVYINIIVSWSCPFSCWTHLLIPRNSLKNSLGILFVVDHAMGENESGFIFSFPICIFFFFINSD